MVATPHPVTVGQVHLLSCCKYTIEVDDTLKHAHYFSASLTPPTLFQILHYKIYLSVHCRRLCPEQLAVDQPCPEQLAVEQTS